ncbi:MAG: DNA adenine methylase [Anaerolineales bacterium]|nr:DNA adenine methylase [Anaerolineales bacterium]
MFDHMAFLEGLVGSGLQQGIANDVWPDGVDLKCDVCGKTEHATTEQAGRYLAQRCRAAARDAERGGGGVTYPGGKGQSWRQIVNRMPPHRTYVEPYLGGGAVMLNGWPTHSYQAVDRGGNVRTEWLWMNYPEPMRLHDYRYLGDDYRERERIQRKKARWVRRLKNMDALERRAIMWAIEEAGLGVSSSIAANSDTAAPLPTVVVAATTTNNDMVTSSRLMVADPVGIAGNGDAFEESRNA